MSRTLIIALAALVVAVPSAQATDVNLSCVAQGCESSFITVGPGCAISYRVTAELGDPDNQGLAAIFFDLEFDGGTLAQAASPTGLPMASFAPPAGFSNAEGYGGTMLNGNLVQIGGAQNVLLHGAWDCETDDDCPGTSACGDGLCAAIPGLPLGTVVSDVAGPGDPVLVTTGVVEAPATPGSYTLHLANAVADVLQHGATGKGFWNTETAGIGVLQDLYVTVVEGGSCCDFGPCCLWEGSCEMAYPGVCSGTLGGTPLGLSQTCGGEEACWQADGCVMADRACCNFAIEGTAMGAGTTCEDDGDGDAIPDWADQCPGANDLHDADNNGVADCLEVGVEVIPVYTPWGLAILALGLIVAARFIFFRRA